MTKRITIDFSVNAITSLGEEVYIIGNLVELGVWNVNNGLKLQTSKQLYPEWRNRKPLQIHPNVSIQFKIFIKNSQGFIRWERIQENRKFVPIESVLINLSQSKMQMTFQQKVVQQLQMTVRKNTYQIIHDLSDEVSQESSSGNERQFWMERRARQRATLSSSKQFVADAKLIYSAWMPERFKAKPRKVNQWLQLIPSIHYLIRKQLENRKKQPIIQKNILRLAKHPIIIRQQINKKFDELSKIQSLQQPDDILKIFHVEIDNDPWCKQAVRRMKQNYQGQFVMYLNNNVHLTNSEEDILEYAQIIVVRNKKMLKQCLQKFHPRKNHNITMIKQNEFLVKKENNASVLIFYDPSISVSLDDQQFSSKYEYFSCIQKNIIGHKSFQLPQNLRISLLMQKNILSKVRNNRFCMIIMCQKLVQIPQKIIAKLIRVSSCQNVNINIMTSDEISQIFKRLPVSQNDKLLAYNRHGQVFKPGKKPANLYEQLHVNHKKYEQTFKKLKNIASYWVQNREIQIKQLTYSLEFFCSKNALGEAISQHLAIQFNKLDDINKYPYQVQKYLSQDKQNYVVHIRPVLSSTQFYSRIITSINFNSNQTTYFFVFDYTNDRYKIIDKIYKGIGQRNSICQGFLMANSSNKGLKEQKFAQFLIQLINQTYSIIQEDMQKDAKVGNKKDKNAIRSELIN